MASRFFATIRAYSDASSSVHYHIESRKGGEHHAHSTLARRRQPIVGRVAGLVFLVLAIEVFVIPSYLEEWGEILLGLALVVAPWTIGYESVSATVSSMVSGILVILFGAWELMADRDFIPWLDERWHPPAT